MICGSETTWATEEDLYTRYGDEFVDKLAIRRNWDEDEQQYVADESDEAKAAVIALALCDAQNLIIQKLSCLYSNTDILNTELFGALKQWHIRLTIETLKNGGDCMGCACNVDLDRYIGCGNICSDEGNCLVSTKTFFSVTEAHFQCECNCSGGCCCESQ